MGSLTGWLMLLWNLTFSGLKRMGCSGETPWALCLMLVRAALATLPPCPMGPGGSMGGGSFQNTLLLEAPGLHAGMATSMA